MADHWVQLAVSVVTAIPAVLAFFKAKQLAGQVQEVKISMDGRMDELLKLTRAKARAEGLNEGKETGAAAERERAAQDLKDSSAPAVEQAQTVQDLTVQLLTAQVQSAQLQSDKPITVVGSPIPVSESEPADKKQ